MILWRRAMVEVRWAKGLSSSARKAVIEPGGALRVGRSERADLSVPSDRKLSGIHCEIRWDGERCTVTDRSTQGEMLVCGERANEAEVASGGWIRAGDTVFSIYLEGATPPRPGSGLRGDGTDRLTRVQEDALTALQAEPAPLFAVLDAARDPRVVEVLQESVETYRSLYEGMKGEAMAAEAPYLVRLPRGSRLLEQTVLEGWGKAWGVYLTCRRPFDEVRTHLRRLLRVIRDRTNDPIYFRFYDPQMLRLFLPTCGVRQKEQIFGEIEAFLVAGRRAEIVRLTAQDGGHPPTPGHDAARASEAPRP